MTDTSGGRIIRLISGVQVVATCIPKVMNRKTTYTFGGGALSGLYEDRFFNGVRFKFNTMQNWGLGKYNVVYFTKCKIHL